MFGNTPADKILPSHIPSLKAMAPTQSEPPFLAAQGATLVLFVILGIFAFKRFRPA